MVAGPWEAFKTQPTESQEQGPWVLFGGSTTPTEPQEQGPWVQFGGSTTPTEPKPEDQSFLRSVADVPLKIAGGVVGGVRLISDAFGAGSATSNALKGAEDWVADLYSAQSKKDSQEIARIMKDAEDKGVLDQVTAAIKAFSVAPIDTLTHALGTSAPAIAAGLGAAVLGTGTAAAAAIGLGAKALTGAAMGAGTVKGAIYDAVKEELGKTGMSKGQIESRAQLAQEYGGKNLDQILMGTGIGAVAATTGFEASAARQLASGITSKAAATESAKKATELAAKRGALKQGAVTAGKEFAGEAVEGGQEQLAQNIALQREGFDTPTMRGVIGQATLEGLAGAGLGGVGGAREAMAARRELAPVAVPTQTKEEKETELALPADERLAVISARLQAEQGLDADDADRLAKLTVAEQDVDKAEAEKAKAPAVPGVEPEGVTPDMGQVNSLTDAFVQSGMDPDEAYDTALQMLAEMEQWQPYEDTDTERTGGQDVARPDEQPSGVSPSVAGEPSAGLPAEGLGAPKPDGVVPAGQDAGRADEGKGLPPAAIDEAPVDEEEFTPYGWDGGTDTTEELDARTTQPTQEADVAGPAEPATTAEGQVPTTEATAADVVKGRGRPALAPEQRAASDEKRKQQRAAYNQKKKAADTDESHVAAAEGALTAALVPLNTDEIDSDTALRNAERDHRVARVRAIKGLVLLKDKLKGTPHEARIDHALGHAQIKPQEIADIKKGIAAGKVSRSDKGAKTGQVDTGFSNVTNGAQAIAQIIKTGNAFQKLVARRIRNALNNVKVMVVEQGQALPEQLRKNPNDWARSRGMYIYDPATGSHTVYLRGASFGGDQGVNNVVALHELLHAATNQKLRLAMSGLSPNALLSKNVRALNMVMENARKDYETLDALGLVTPELREVVNSTLEIEDDGSASYAVFSSPGEFLAYGMTEEAFQDFLLRTDAFLEEQTKSLMDRFVEAIMGFFGLGPDQFNAMTDLVVITNRLLHAPKTASMRQEEKDEQQGAVQALRASPARSQQASRIMAKLQKGNFADAIRDGGTIQQAVGMFRDPRKFGDFLAVQGKQIKLQPLLQLLPALQTDVITEWGTNEGIVGLTESARAMDNMNAMIIKLNNAMAPLVDALGRLHRKGTDQYQKLADVMHISSLEYTDPSKDTSHATLNKMWSELTAESKALYEKVRDFYIARHKLHFQLLEAKIEQSDLAGNSNDSGSPKGKLMAEIRKMYEDGRKLYPYFPLKRYGQYWVRVGKASATEFEMFDSPVDRDTFVRERVRQMQDAGDSRTEDEMREGPSPDIEDGNDMQGARKYIENSSTMVKDIINAIDNATQSATGTTAVINSTELKDHVYQLFLQTLPDRSFRKQFLKRKGTAGFSGDITRNLADSGTNSATQLARLKYGAQVMDQLTRAQDALEGNPDRARLGEFVTELRIRAEAQIRPKPEDGFWHGTARFLNTAAFGWMMSGIKTAVAQVSAIPVFVGPVLVSKHGPKALLALGKSLNVFNSMGVTKTNPDGSKTYTAPTFEGANEDERKAIKYMVDRGITTHGMVYELGGRRDVSTAKFQSGHRAVTRVVVNGMTALFHHSERMIREVTFMTSYRLNRSEGKPHEEALELADAETKEALNSYDKSQRPRGLGGLADHKVMLDAHGPIGRAVLQFKMYPAFVTTYFVRNFMRMVAGETKEIKKQAAIQFIGSLTTSFALAGYAGLPGISMAMGIMQGILNGLRGDDEDDPLEGRDLEFFFRNKWLPGMFGEVKIGNRSLDELLDKGAVAALTGYDITSSLAMNNMWFPEKRDQATAVEEVQSWLLSLAGPGASLATTQVPKAIDYFNQGKILNGMEQLSPAIFRAPLTAYKFSEEGATTARGGIIKNPEDFTKGQLLAQAAGFATEGLQAHREAIFKLQGEILKVQRERNKLLARFELELNQGSDEGVSDALEGIIKFSSRNPASAIAPKDIKQSIKKRAENRYKTAQGFPIEKKFYPQVAELLEPSLKKLERERAEQ